MHNLAHVCRPIHELFNVMKLAKGSAEGGGVGCTCHIIASEGYGQLSQSTAAFFRISFLYSLLHSRKIVKFSLNQAVCWNEPLWTYVTRLTHVFFYFQNIIRFHGTRVHMVGTAVTCVSAALLYGCSPSHNRPVSSTPENICVLSADENLFTPLSKVWLSLSRFSGNSRLLGNFCKEILYLISWKFDRRFSCRC